MMEIAETVAGSRLDFSTDEANQPQPITIVSNRLPITRDEAGRCSLSPGGLVRALLPVMRAHEGVWVGWDGQLAGEHDLAGLEEPPQPFEHDGLGLVNVPLTEDDYKQYYRCVANEMIWPLFHDGVRHPTYDADAWEGYERVNRRFARAAAASTPRGGVVWLHDYHLLLAPGLLRAARPDLRIGLFIHIPIPPVELFATLPWRENIAAALRGCDLIGTQTAPDAEHLRQIIKADEDDASGAGTSVEAFPISVESDSYRAAAKAAELNGSVARVRDDLCRERTTMLLGVDRLDYTKGIDKRLEALELALEQGLIDPDEVCFVQVAVPNRESVSDYREIGERVDALVGRINGVYGGMNGPVVHYIRGSLGQDELVALYRAADVMVVTPLRDGMNLVAKEYVATRFDGTGELVLSEFAGAAQEFGQARLVNPHDVQSMAETLARACRQHAVEPGASGHAMERMHAHVCAHDVHRWSRSFLERLRLTPAAAPARVSSVEAKPRAYSDRGEAGDLVMSN